MIRAAVGGAALCFGLLGLAGGCAAVSGAGATLGAVTAGAVAEAARPGDPCLASAPGGRVSAGGIAGAAQAVAAAGWPRDQWVTVLAVAGAESGYRRDARNTTADGADYVGLLQISSVHGAVIAAHGGDRTDLLANAEMGLDVWRAQGWGAWEAYTTGAYQAFLEQAAAAAQALDVGAVHDGAAPCAGAPVAAAGPFLTAGDRVAWRSGVAAAAWARSMDGSGYNPVQRSSWRDWCANFAAQAYGQTGYGLAYAIQGFERWEHHADRNPPVGAFVYWRTSNPARHVAVYVGGGLIATTDYPRTGSVGVVPIGALEAAGWGPYLGWARPPYAR